MSRQDGTKQEAGGLREAGWAVELAKVPIGVDCNYLFALRYFCPTAVSPVSLPPASLCAVIQCIYSVLIELTSYILRGRTRDKYY